MPALLEGRDIAGLAQTGTGKTAAFLLPMMERILCSRQPLAELNEEQQALIKKRAFTDWQARSFILVLVPTRELAEQVSQNAIQLGQDAGLKVCTVYGGTSYDKQKEMLKQGVEFVVATPGRLIDLYKENIVDLKQVKAIIFDEADRMFDMGFKDDMKFVLSRVPRERQFLVFSATLNFDVLNTAYQFGAEPIEIDVSRDQAKAENVKDEIFHVGQDEKPAYLLSLIKAHNPKQVIIFSNFKTNVDRIVRFLNSNGVPTLGISSLLTQAQRNRVMEQFKSDDPQNILVATDVAARGLDVKGVDLVINFELPMDAENYVHRIGRTGRAGEVGRAFSLVSDRDVDSLARIEDYLKHKLTMGWLEEEQIIKDHKPFPREDFSDKPFRPKSASVKGGRGGFDGGRRPEKRPRADRPQRVQQSDMGPAPKLAQPRSKTQGATGRTQTGKHAKNKNQKTANGRKFNNKSHPSAGKPPRLAVRKSVQMAAQKSVTGKIAQFFKRLFS